MYPVALNVAKIPILLVGKGELVTRRLQMLHDAGATQVKVIEIPPPAGERLGGGLDDAIQHIMPPPQPSPCGGGGYPVVMVAGLSREESEAIAMTARAAGKLVNVEDVNDLCDFYFTANVRRGDLIIAVSTSGASPTLARKIRDYIADIFDDAWEGRVAEAASKRLEWKKQGKPMQEMMQLSEAYINEKGWLS